MPRPYSVDLRERVLRAHEAGEGSQRVLAARFGVSVGAVCNWLAAARSEGRRGPRPHGGGRRALGGADPRALAALVDEQSDATLAQYAARLAECAGGGRPSLAAVCRALARLGLPRKKPCTRASKDARTSQRRARAGGPRYARAWTRPGSCSWTRPAWTRP
jgi:transposase